MKKIEQTTLSMQDIEEHNTVLKQQHCFGLFLSADRRQEIADKMIERFISTFLEDIEL